MRSVVERVHHIRYRQTDESGASAELVSLLNRWGSVRSRLLGFGPV